HALDALSSAGAYATISLAQDDEQVARAFVAHFRAGVDVVLDYLWGARARAALLAAAKAPQQARPVRFVPIGTIGGAELPLPGAV
ncbi:zinc-binding alcohol dehydrogenase family protein, partial [Burkholderia pseudomallei]